MQDKTKLNPSTCSGVRPRVEAKSAWQAEVAVLLQLKARFRQLVAWRQHATQRCVSLSLSLFVSLSRSLYLRVCASASEARAVPAEAGVDWVPPVSAG